jgi:small-conductance mechanosensitive channel
VPILVVVAAAALAQASPAPASQAPGSDVLNHLNAAISWYRDLSSMDQGAGQPSDVLYLSTVRSQARQALQAAFQAAQEMVKLQPSAGTAGTAESGDSSDQPHTDQQNIARALQGSTDRLAQDQAQLAQVQKDLNHAPANRGQELVSRRDTLQGQIELDQAMLESLQKITAFFNSSETASSTLGVKVSQLQQSVPEAFANAENPAPKATNGNTNATRAQASGLIGQASYLFNQTRDIHEMERIIVETERLRDSADKLQKPWRDELRSLVQQGRDVASQSPATGPGQAESAHNSLSQLTARFRQVSGAAMPLRQEMVLLEQSRGNLEEWHNSMVREYGVILRSLLLRVGGILLALGAVFVFSELWQRVTMRYVQDARRRRQLLLVRRFVTGFLMMMVVVLGFVSEFSSLATFAGFITAGVAVALQTVLLSVAAYFMLIGRRGVRVGDRITVAGVTGDVLEIGLVRLHLMELGGTGVDLYPTGRVVVFSNSVLFGATPMYKQLPGTSYAWHELGLTFGNDADPAMAQRALMVAVNTVYTKYREVIQHQHAVLERALDTVVPQPEPTAKWQFSDTGLELVLRYPVVIDRAAETDDQMTRELMRALASNPSLKSAMASAPKLRAAIKA